MKKTHLTLLLLAFSSFVANANEPWRAALQKVHFGSSAVVPIICQWDNPKYSAKKWTKKYGPDFVWMNHYCSSKASIPVCWGYPSNERNQCLTSLLRGIEYSISHPKDRNFALLPFLHTEHGVLLATLKRHHEAVQAFQAALKLNKKYIPAYTKLADTFMALKDYKAAESIVRQGLLQKKSKALKKRLAEIEAAKK